MLMLPELVMFGFITAVAGQELRIIPEGGTFTRSLGTNIVFTCEVYRLGPQTADINLQWFDKNGLEILTIAGPGRLMYIEKEESIPTKKLYFTHIRAEHAGTYSCSGVVGGNRQEQSVQLLLYQEITFVEARSPQHPIIYTQGLILCRVTGHPTPTVSWRYKGQKITSTTSSRYSQDYQGLIIKNVTKEDDGLYTCRAEVDIDGRLDERVIDVIVHIPPNMTTKSVNLQGIQSQEYVLPCRATGFPDPKYEFTRDNEQNILYSTHRVYIDFDSGNIYFRPLHKEDEATYKCRAYNNAGSDYGELNLQVLVPPTIVPFVNVSQQEGYATTLVCNSNGDPPPDMVFQKQSNPAPYQMGENEGGRIVVSNPMSGRLELLVKDLIPEDTANYTCTSNNSAGFHVRNGTITVYFKPRFAADQVKQVYIWPGKTRNITCNVEADPWPVIEWIRFRYPLRTNETFRIYHMGKNSNLQVTAREYDVLWLFGNYTCRARNQYGQTDVEITLVRALLPGPPKSVKVVEKTSDLVVLEAEPPEDNGGEQVIGYRVDFEDKILTFLHGDKMLIEHLRPSTTFAMRIRALTEVGYGPPLPLSVTMDDVKPPSQLQLIDGTTDLHKYTVIWAKPVTGGRPIRQYEFRFRPVDQDKKPIGAWFQRDRIEGEDPHKFYYIIEGLNPGTTYELEVRARNDVDWSPVAQQYFSTDPGQFALGTGHSTRPGLQLICVFYIYYMFLRDLNV